MPLTLFTSPRFADHLTPPGHPERVERFEVMQAIAAEFSEQGGEVREPRPATREELIRVHDADYVGLIAATAGRATALDPDTFTSPQTYEAACLAAGAVISAVDWVIRPSAATSAPAKPGRGKSQARNGPRRDIRRALALVRPPGHHAERHRAMGFCFFNNIAVAAAHARANGLGRVAIVDFDVHHGNGTQWTFYTDPSVLFVSSHQFPYYPGTGAADETGTGAGAGFTVNLPLAAGATDADYELVYSRVAIPVLRQFAPELILVSAGFDAYRDDPLGGMRLTPRCFGRLTAMIAGVADEYCGGRLVAVTEGGYSLDGLAACLRETIDALGTAPLDSRGTGVALEASPYASVSADQSASADGLGSDDNVESGGSARGEATLQRVLPHLARYWQL